VEVEEEVPWLVSLAVSLEVSEVALEVSLMVSLAESDGGLFLQLANRKLPMAIKKMILLKIFIRKIIPYIDMLSNKKIWNGVTSD